MAPKPDANAIIEVTLRVRGGEVPGGSVLAPKIGPLGMSPKKVGDDIAKCTKAWKGMNVTVKLTCQNRQAAVSLVPTSSSLVVKALKEPDRDRKKVKHVKHSGNISLDEIIDIARQMQHKSMSKTLAGGVKEILGTAFSVGCTVGGKNPCDVCAEIDDGTPRFPPSSTSPVSPLLRVWLLSCVFQLLAGSLLSLVCPCKRWGAWFAFSWAVAAL
ncbi:ribosomal protein L11 [Baffinella frigidus]|nr:ribosomal protein L11 [Cryptophyta sp. CCMP2293]